MDDDVWNEIYIRLRSRGNHYPTQQDILEMAYELRNDMYEQRKAGDAVEDMAWFQRLVTLSNIVGGLLREK